MNYAGPAATLAVVAVIAGALYIGGNGEGWVKGSASGTALVAWAFGLLALGFACKLAHLGDEFVKGGSSSYSSFSTYWIRISLSEKLNALTWITVALVALETIYVFLLHLTLLVHNK
ncbi:hypothetical protein R1flu_005084 [Riccia fluitans]|uniref:Uncharacterized protein n=1 Tax=Riccia fluitans TaxID=41844 RepID=A0ABD1YS49_9MARC